MIAAAVHTLGHADGPKGIFLDVLFGFLPSADNDDLQEDVWLALDAAAVRGNCRPRSSASPASPTARNEQLGYLLAHRGDTSQHGEHQAPAHRSGYPGPLAPPRASWGPRTRPGYRPSSDCSPTHRWPWHGRQKVTLRPKRRTCRKQSSAPAPRASRQVREAWEAWWRSEADPGPQHTEAQAQQPVCTLTHTYWCDPDLIQLWGAVAPQVALKTTGQLSDAHLLPGGTLLVVVYASGPRVKSTDSYGLSERDVTGRVLWEYKVKDAIWCQPLRGRPEINLGILGLFEPDEPLPPHRTVAA